MKRWLIGAFLAWLAAVGSIAAFTLQALYTSAEPTRWWPDYPDGSIDDEPAHIMHSYISSSVRRGDQPAWRMRQLSMLPVSQLVGSHKNPAPYWRAVAIEQPYHLAFIKPDGSRTGPHRVGLGEAEATAILGVASGWTRQGQQFILSTGYKGYPQNETLLEGRFWNRAVVTEFALEQLVWVALATAAAVLIVIVAGIIRVVRR